MYSFVPPFREAKHRRLSCVFEKLGCAAGEKKRLRNTVQGYTFSATHKVFTVNTSGSIYRVRRI
jgi:hypothetical protein